MTDFQLFECSSQRHCLEDDRHKLGKGLSKPVILVHVIMLNYQPQYIQHYSPATILPYNTYCIYTKRISKTQALLKHDFSETAEFMRFDT